MNDEDRDAYVRRYEERLNKHGYSPEALGWGKHGRQEVRFAVLSDPILRVPGSSVLDVGCGFADFYSYLCSRGWSGNYTGIDIVPGLLNVARQRLPRVRLELRDLSECTKDTLGVFDFVIASGVFNAKLQSDDNNLHIERSVQQMFELCRQAVAVDFLSSQVSYQDPIAWHTDPTWAIALARRLTRRFSLRHDYMPYEFSLYLFRDDSLSPRNVFTATESAMKAMDKDKGLSSRSQHA